MPRQILDASMTELLNTFAEKAKAQEANERPKR
jgi:hypothetical protein